jgi:hypothetical protein
MKAILGSEAKKHLAARGGIPTVGTLGKLFLEVQVTEAFPPLHKSALL